MTYSTVKSEAPLSSGSANNAMSKILHLVPYRSFLVLAFILVYSNKHYVYVEHLFLPID